jgi:signal transduction histidine kinase
LEALDGCYDLIELGVPKGPAVPNLAADALSAGSGQDDLPLVIAAMPISGRERRIAFGVIIVLAIIDVITVTFGNVQLARVDAFIPAAQTVMSVIDLVTAALLFAQYAIHPARAVLSVASGYVFSGFFAFIQTLAFPGAYSAIALIGDGINSAAWFFVLWHTTFPLSLILYARLKDEGVVTNLSSRSIGVNIASTIAGVLAATGVLTWLAVDGVRYLPSLYVNLVQQTLFASNVDIFLWAVNIATIMLLFVHRRTVLDFWLMIVLFAWWPNFLVAAFYPIVRFSAGWYLARVIALMASSTLLVVLLTESTALYGRLANAYLMLRRERAHRLSGADAATAAIAHELRQPLTAIAIRGTAGLNWLKRTPPELNMVSECLDGMIDASHRAEEMIASIRGLFKKTVAERTAVQINDVVREVLDLVQDDLRGGGITAAAEYQNDLPEIHVAHTQIQQLILNLVKNAIEAMRSAPPGKRHLRLATALHEKSGVAVYVRDSGVGIALEDRGRIFDPFFTTKPSGMGLGLSICRAFAEDHGGDLRLSKTDHHGTSFELILPISSSTGART